MIEGEDFEHVLADLDALGFVMERTHGQVVFKPFLFDEDGNCPRGEILRILRRSWSSFREIC